VDPENAGASSDDPQSWNGYAYARSNPVVLSDPDGRKYEVCSLNGSSCVTYDDDDFWALRSKGKKLGYSFSGNEDFFEFGTIFDAEGNPIANYNQSSIDDPVREFSYEMRQALEDPANVGRAARNVVLLNVFKGAARGGSPRGGNTAPNRNRLSQAAAEPDRGGLTKAGRSLTKHAPGQRSGSTKFPTLSGNPQQINRQAQDIVDHILTNPGTTVVYSHRGRFGQTVEFTDPSGRGIVYNSKGEFLFFKE
jgi:hypothetical protein